MPDADAGAWSFGINSDDGARLRIDGADVIVDDSRHAAADIIRQVANLSAGEHEIELVFFEHGGAAVVELFAAPGMHTTFAGGGFQLIGDTANGGLEVIASPSRANWSDGGVDIRVGDGNFRVQTPWDVGQDPRRRQIRGFTMDG